MLVMSNAWLQQLKAWIRARTGGCGEPPESAGPDYVACPHCGEPEVEVWPGGAPTHCHNCGEIVQPGETTTPPPG